VISTVMSRSIYFDCYFVIAIRRSGVAIRANDNYLPRPPRRALYHRRASFHERAVSLKKSVTAQGKMLTATTPRDKHPPLHSRIAS
jgi:hypothetical protein